MILPQSLSSCHLHPKFSRICRITENIFLSERYCGKTWPNGEVLYKHSIQSGLLFKKLTATLFFAGNQKDISSFLTQGPYEGDYVKDVVVMFNYNSLGSDGDVNTTFTRKYANIRKAIEAINDKNDTSFWNELKESKAKEYKKHLVNDKLVEPSVNIVFYSVQPVEENRMFGITFTPGHMTPRD